MAEDSVILTISFFFIISLLFHRFFSISSIPIFIIFFVATIRSSGPKGMLGKVNLARSSLFIGALNIMCNIYIYWFTVLSFRQFIKSKVVQISEIMVGYFSPREMEQNAAQPGVTELRPVSAETLT